MTLAGLLIGSMCSVKAQNIISGDTFERDGITYKIWGIDAPAQSQTCHGKWPAGEKSIQAMRDLLRPGSYRCEGDQKDSQGRIVTVCRSEGGDLGATMVRRGMAWATRGLSKGYVVEEA